MYRHIALMFLSKAIDKIRNAEYPLGTKTCCKKYTYYSFDFSPVDPYIFVSVGVTIGNNGKILGEFSIVDPVAGTASPLGWPFRLYPESFSLLSIPIFYDDEEDELCARFEIADYGERSIAGDLKTGPEWLQIYDPEELYGYIEELAYYAKENPSQFLMSDPTYDLSDNGFW